MPLFSPTSVTNTELNDYIEVRNPDALQAVQTGSRANVFPELTAAEKAIIYHYTDVGFEDLNEALHEGKVTANNVLGSGLVIALNKLQAHQDVVYSGAYITPKQLKACQNALVQQKPFIWPAFLSSSISLEVARRYLTVNYLNVSKNCLFTIQSKKGRLIEEVAVYGSNGQLPGQNEREVLFTPDTHFNVKRIEQLDGFNQIIIEEI
jgi:hypothetical protein